MIGKAIPFNLVKLCYVVLFCAVSWQAAEVFFFNPTTITMYTSFFLLCALCALFLYIFICTSGSIKQYSAVISLCLLIIVAINAALLFPFTNASNTEETIITNDPSLGHILKKNFTKKFRFEATGKVNTYTTDEYGRISTLKSKDNFSESIWALGCSHTFGLGVDDLETWPAILQAELPNFKIYNLGVPGYGIQEFLFLIEKNLLEKVIPHHHLPPNYVIYMGIPDHVIRLATVTYWLKDRPWYVYQNNQIRYMGNFTSSIYNRFLILIKKSVFFENGFYNLNYLLNLINDNEIQAYVTAVKYLQHMIYERFGTKMIFLFHHEPEDSFDSRVYDALVKAEIGMISMFDIFGQDVAAEMITIPNDGHPNIFAHEYIGKYVANTIKGIRPSSIINNSPISNDVGQ